MSIGRGSEYTIAGRSYNPPTGMQSVLDAGGEHAGRRVEWLFGHDFFAANRMLIDWRNRSAQILSPSAVISDGLSIPIELVMGVPIVRGRSGAKGISAVIDSGASLSYVPTDVVEGLTPTGKRKDFYPGFGEFETDVWRVRAEIGGRRLAITAGVLPPMLQVMFGMILGSDGWIVGSDFFRNRSIIIDYPGSRMVDVTASE